MPSQKSSDPEVTQKQNSNPVKNFLLGASLSGILIFAYLSLSVDMTYGSLAAVETWRLAVAIAVPIACGLLAVFFKDRAIAWLSQIFESANFPF
ncbi:hypothetical protein [Baaleninema simplex]|uniref:hypothetical protein n=1 Tax=Baaleninema simplex TaxID=2862350 RepID=UPI0011819FF5|nr:hypothetical protein [Baaleninema simplex]